MLLPGILLNTFGNSETLSVLLKTISFITKNIPVIFSRTPRFTRTQKIVNPLSV